MASLTAENQTTVFIIAPQLSSLSIAHGFEQDVRKKGEDQKVLENQTTVVLGTAPLSMTHGLKQDVMTKDEDLKVLEKLKKELEFKYRKAYMLRLLIIEMIFESEKLMFTRTMEKAWFINSIFKEMSVISCHSGKGDHLTHHKVIEKVMGYNKKIKLANFLGLDHLLCGPSKKRKHSLYKTYDQALDEALEECDENILNCNETALQMVNSPNDTDKFGNYSKKTYRRAYHFAKLESREKYLESVINSLEERETEREIKQTEIEILGFMFLKKIAYCTLNISSRDLLNSITLSSGACPGDGDEQDRNIHVEINEQLYTEYANAMSDFEMSFTSRYNAFVQKAKSDCNNSNNELERMKEMLALVEELIRKGNECLVIDKHYQNAWAVERRYERENFKYCEDLSYYMRLGRWLDPVSEIEDNRLNKILCLACDAIDEYKRANGPDSIPTITQPILPTWCNL